jgi:hypothetical protein
MEEADIAHVLNTFEHVLSRLPVTAVR